MTRGFIRRGQPLMALVLVLGGWVSARAMMWDAGGMPRIAVAPPPEALLPEPVVQLTASVARPAAAPISRPLLDAFLLPLLQDRPLFEQAPQTIAEPVTFARTEYYARRPVFAARPAPLTRPASAPARQPGYTEAPPAGDPWLEWRPALARESAAAGLAGIPDNQAPFPVAPASRAAEGRWSADGWVLWRRGSRQSIAAGGFAPSYGASQAGAVLRYRLSPGSAHRPAAFLRTSAALNGTAEREVALGLQARPFGGVPVVLAGEARVTATPGRTMVRPAVFAVTELPPFALPLGLRGEFYAQGGYAGGKFATAFADGQLRVDRRLLGLGPAEMRLGGGVWGGAQKGAARLDAGPSLILAAPLGSSAAMRLGADWRFRVAGKAAPASGPAVTLSAGF